MDRNREQCNETPQRIDEGYGILDESQDQEQEQIQTPSVRQERPLSPKTRRKLDLVKCDRCRVDKQKCSPSGRLWPVRCDRCIAKGFPCSKGKRLERKSKHAVALSSAPTLVPILASIPEIENTTECQSFRREWFLLTGYHINLTKAMEYLRALQEETFRPFQNPVATRNRTRNTPSIDEIESNLRKTSRNIVKLANNHLEKGLSIDSLSGPSIICSVLPMSGEMSCPVCYEGVNDKLLEALGQSEDIFSQFQHRQSRLEAHFRADRHSVIGKLEAETRLYKTLSISIMRLLWDHFKDLELDSITNTSLFHPSAVGHALFAKGIELPDCLGRTPLHQLLDVTELDHSAFSFEWCDTLINEQDILGRSPLHIICQKGWEIRANSWILFDANPSLTTMYGSLPLHYAAASGHLINCKTLIGKMATPNIFQKDCEGRTPLDYARANGHMDVVQLLARYTIHVRGIGENQRRM